MSYSPCRMEASAVSIGNCSQLSHKRLPAWPKSAIRDSARRRVFPAPMRVLYHPILLAVLAFVLFFSGLSAVGLVGPDEPRYAAVARGMLRSGDYITPRLFDLPW